MYNYTPVRIGILGASGYAGRELSRLLATHPRAQVAFASSESEAGSTLHGVKLVRTEDAALDACEVVISCLPHGVSLGWMERVREMGMPAIDLSADLRVPGAETPSWARGAVYGMPELHRERIARAKLVANPGCYPTATLLALAPLLRRELVAGPVVVDAASGVTGAGRSAKRELLFSEVAENFRAYAVGNTHRHLAEMRCQAVMLGRGTMPDLVFTPHLLPVRRGILATIHVPLAEPLNSPEALWLDDYAGEPFVRVLSDGTPTLADAVGTNQVVIGVAPVQGTATPMVTVIAAIDNLLKGAAGQAVQNLNLMFGWPETEGLA